MISHMLSIFGEWEDAVIHRETLEERKTSEKLRNINIFMNKNGEETVENENTRRFRL